MEYVLKLYKFKVIEVKENNQKQVLRFLHDNSIDYSWAAHDDSFTVYDNRHSVFTTPTTTDFIVHSGGSVEVYCKQDFNEKFEPYQFYV